MQNYTITSNLYAFLYRIYEFLTFYMSSNIVLYSFSIKFCSLIYVESTHTRKISNKIWFFAHLFVPLHMIKTISDNWHRN